MEEEAGDGDMYLQFTSLLWFLFQEEERYPFPSIRRANLEEDPIDLLGSCTYLLVGRKEISSVVTHPPGSHEINVVVLQGKAGVGRKQIPTTSSLGHY